MLAPQKKLHSTPLNVIEEALKYVKLKKEDNHVLYDIGCGDGRCVVYAAEKYGIQCVGIEINPMRAEKARQCVKEKGLEHLVEIKCGNALEMNLSQGTMMFLFLTKRGLRLLAPQLSSIDHPVYLITYLYDFPQDVVKSMNLEMIKKQFCKNPNNSGSFPFYIYRKGHNASN